MVRIAIFTAGNSGKRILELCKKMDNVIICAFVDNNANLYAKTIESIPIISPYKIKYLIEKGEIDFVIVPSDRMISYGLREHINQLNKLNIKKYKILPSWLIRKPRIEKDDVNIASDILMNGKYGEINQLQHIQFHVIDNCNLNCRRCQHFSNIAEKESFADFDVVKKDFIRLSHLVDDINTIAILGGEPLLNPQLEEYIKMIRSLFPHSRLEIITNGILVRKMPQTLIDSINDNDALVNVSYYPVLENCIEDIVNFLQNNKIHYLIGKHIDYFSKKLSLTPEKLPAVDMQTKFDNCRDACCTTLRNGKLYPCYLPATAFVLNKRFGCNIGDNDSGINIYDNISGFEIIKRLSQPFNICRYCTNDEIYSWEQTRRVELSDWVV